jgi:hypothetical protein
LLKGWTVPSCCGATCDPARQQLYVRLVGYANGKLEDLGEGLYVHSYEDLWESHCDLAELPFRIVDLLRNIEDFNRAEAFRCEGRNRGKGDEKGREEK